MGLALSKLSPVGFALPFSPMDHSGSGKKSAAFVPFWTRFLPALSVLDPTSITPGEGCPSWVPWDAEPGKKSVGFVAFCRAFLARLSVLDPTSLPVSHRGRVRKSGK